MTSAINHQNGVKFNSLWKIWTFVDNLEKAVEFWDFNDVICSFSKSKSSDTLVTLAESWSGESWRKQPEIDELWHEMNSTVSLSKLKVVFQHRSVWYCYLHRRKWVVLWFIEGFSVDFSKELEKTKILEKNPDFFFDKVEAGEEANCLF